jgi:hypothetical protein
MRVPTFTDVRVVGMRFRERDGVPAIAIVGSFVPPLFLTLQREPENRFDPHAIKVLFNNQHIGYIEATKAAFIAPYMDEHEPLFCRVDSLLAVKSNLHPVVTIGPDDEAS